MEPIEGSETSAFKPQTPGKYPKENILQNLDFSTPEDETTMLSGNIMNQIPSNAVFYLKRTDTKSTLSFTHPSDPANTAYLREFTTLFTILHLQDQHTITYT